MNLNRNSNYYSDLHIHSALSPSADDSMSPNHIVGMSLVLGLDAITVADCNCAANAPAVASLARAADLTFVPGIEMISSEGERLLAFLPGVGAAVDLGERLYGALATVAPRKGTRQLVMDELDQVTDERSKKLDEPLPYDTARCVALAGEYGAVVLADRGGDSAERRLLASGAGSLEEIGDPARLVRLASPHVGDILALLGDSGELNAIQEEHDERTGY